MTRRKEVGETHFRREPGGLVIVAEDAPVRACGLLAWWRDGFCR